MLLRNARLTPCKFGCFQYMTLYFARPIEVEPFCPGKLIKQQHPWHCNAFRMPLFFKQHKYPKAILLLDMLMNRAIADEIYYPHEGPSTCERREHGACCAVCLLHTGFRPRVLEYLEYRKSMPSSLQNCLASLGWHSSKYFPRSISPRLFRSSVLSVHKDPVAHWEIFNTDSHQFGCKKRLNSDVESNDMKRNSKANGRRSIVPCCERLSLRLFLSHSEVGEELFRKILTHSHIYIYANFAFNIA
jgi:hypothetical protein